MKNILICICITVLTLTIFESEASETLNILMSSDGNQLSKIMVWSKGKTKEELVNELNQLAKEHLKEIEKKKMISRKHQMELKKKEQEKAIVERTYEALINKEKARYEREKEKVEKMKKEIELQASYRINCVCEEQQILR